MINKYANSCCICKRWVEVGKGTVLSQDGKWNVFCHFHNQDQTWRRELTKEGHIYVNPYDSYIWNKLIVTSWLKYNESDGYWQVNNQNREEVINFALDLDLEIAAEWFDEDNIIHKLYPYQIEGVNWLSKRTRSLLGDELGIGKTIQTIASLNNDEQVLIVCPANVKYNWVNEFSQWNPKFKTSVMTSNNFAWPNPGEAVITSYAMLPDWLLPKKGNKFINFDYKDLRILNKVTLVCDEAQAVRSHTTQRHQKVYQLSNNAKRVIFLTGTPLMNKVKDLLGVLTCLGTFTQVFGSFDNFIRHFNIKKNKFGYEWDKAYASSDVPKLLSRTMLRRLRENVLKDLPDIQYQTLFIDIEEDVKQVLDKKWAAYSGYFAQSNPDLPPFNEFATIRKELALGRIPAMLEFVEEVEDQNIPLVVFSAHRGPIEELSRRKNWKIITGDTLPLTRQKIVDEFQGGKYAGLGLTIQAAGVGTNLTRAYTALVVDKDWTPGANLQAERRLLRIGQKNNVRIIHMVSNHPLDIHLHKVLLRKQRLLESIEG